VSKTFLIGLFLTTCLSLSAVGEDLYKVSVSSQAEADRLAATGVEPILIIKDGYLVLADSKQADLLAGSKLDVEHIAGDVTAETLALDNRRDDKNQQRYETVYEIDGLRLFRVDGAKSLATDDGSSLIPIHNDNMVIRYREPLNLNTSAVYQADDLLELIDKVSQDSVWTYLHILEAFNGRVAGSSGGYAARDWLRSQLLSYGYTDVTLKPFSAYVYGSWRTCYNVVAVKPGTEFPDRQIVIGAHYDAVSGSPGADDNGTGSVGVLELARALADVDTKMTYVFILFDSEEQGLNGAYNYANAAAARGDNIVCMLNMDMIGNLPNNYYADLMYGPDYAYAELWAALSDSLVNITAYMAGSASNSDHHAFVQNGYDVIFAAEHEFSSVYHTNRDSTTYVNFNYCTRMIKATLATAYTINLSPLPVRITSIRDGGDGQSLLVNWLSDDASDIDHYWIYFAEEPSGSFDSVYVAAGNDSLLVTGLTEGQEYRIYVIGYNADGYRSIARTEELGTPYSLPAMPTHHLALPRYRTIQLSWRGENSELDFSHYAVIRDGVMLPYVVTDTSLIDNDFSLGSDFHDYLIVAVDNTGNISDTTGAMPVRMRAATLEAGRILAVNRSNRSNPYIVNEVVTGEFMRDALDGYDYVYLSDTSASSGTDTNSVNLEDMLDYEVIILGGESARTDDFANDPIFGGILDTINYYMSIGGKVIMFGRWGDLSIGKFADTINMPTTGYVSGYRNYFHINRRVRYLSTYTATQINSDLIGAHSQAAGYPDLVWDSAATVNHSAPWAEASGIPCPSFADLTGGQTEILYTYDSRNNMPLTEGKPVAWRYSGEDFQYVFFEIPLSFFDRPTARTVLQTALAGLLSSGSAAVSAIDPDTLDNSATLPPTTAIYLGDFSDSWLAGDVDQSSLLINGALSPQSVTILPSYPGFTGEVLEIDISTAEFIDSYGSIIDTLSKVYTVAWNYVSEPQTHIIFGEITLISQSFVDGDANGDWLVNVADAVYLINFVFKGGPAPDPYEAGDANCDGNPDVGDAVFLINYIFKGGAAPGCN